MAKTVLINAYRRFFITGAASTGAATAAINEAYQAVLSAHQSDATEGVVITSGNFEGGGATAQYVIRPKDREEIMEVFELLLNEIQATADGEVLPSGPNHMDFSHRIVGT